MNTKSRGIDEKVPLENLCPTAVSRPCPFYVPSLTHGDKGKPYGREESDSLLGRCMAATDTPCAAFYRELLDAYPDAKVILTV